jgi:hypothetical protein
MLAFWQPREVEAGFVLRYFLHALILVAAGLGHAHAQTLSLLNQLEFGTFAAQTGGTVTIDPTNGARSRTGDIWLMGERSNRRAAANRAEETLRAPVVARWNAVPRKTGVAVVRNARGLAWSWVTSSTLVNRCSSSYLPRRYPV